MDGMLALTIVCVVFAIGDFISDKTHAIIPVLLFASVTFLILFWTGVVPTTLFTDAGLIAISNMMTGIFIVNMGTLLDFKEFVSQWKTVVLGLAIVIVGGILMFFAARPVLGNNFAVALVGPITGGWVSAVVVNDAIKARGCNKLALGHHFDDAVETFLLSLVYEGRISCFQPVTHMTRTGVDQIRPMLYAGEVRIANLAKALALPIVENPCPEDRGSKRYEIKQFIRTMSQTYPDLRSKVFGAIQRAPLDGWDEAARLRVQKIYDYYTNAETLARLVRHLAA